MSSAGCGREFSPQRGKSDDGRADTVAKAQNGVRKMEKSQLRLLSRSEARVRPQTGVSPSQKRDVRGAATTSAFRRSRI